MVVTTEDSNSIISMHRDDRKGAIIAHVSLITMCTSTFDVNLLTDTKVVMRATSILAQQALVNTTLTKIVNLNDVCNKRNIEVHISIEDNSTR